MHQSSLTPEQALQKIRHYCAYQERCHSEVKEKLYGYGLHKAAVEKIISSLIEDDYLNEERFAAQFAGGRFRMKKWGKVKIRYALRQKNVSEYCIKKGLNAIDEDDYLNTLSQLFTQKLKELKGQKNQFIRKRKIQDYLVQKGYESDLIYSLLRKQSNE